MLTPKQIAQRATAIGGSDVPNLVGLPPYGCTRRLWYDKRGVTPDFPFLGNRHTRRGSILEDIAAGEYFFATARDLRKVPWQLDPENQHFGYNADRIQTVNGRDGILEMKLPTARTFYPIRRKPDPPNEALLQANWGMMVYRVRTATIWLFCADQWEGRYWDVVGDDMMVSDLRSLGSKFWSTLKADEPPHPRLAVDDPRCRECPWRRTCQGLPKDAGSYHPDFEVDGSTEVLEDVNGVEATAAVLQYLGSKERLNDAKAEFDLAKERLIGLFPKEGTILTDVAEAKMKIVNRSGYTTTVKGSTYPLLVVKQKGPECYEDGGELETY